MSTGKNHQRIKIFFDNQEKEAIHFTVVQNTVVEIIDSGNGLPRSSEEFRNLIKELQSNKHSDRITKIQATPDFFDKGKLADIFDCSPEIIYMDLI